MWDRTGGWALTPVLPDTSAAPGEQQQKKETWVLPDAHFPSSSLELSPPPLTSLPHLRLGHVSVLPTQRVKEKDTQPLGAAELSDTFSLLGIAAES